MHLLNEMLLYGMGRDGEGWFILFLFAFLVVYRYNGGDWPGAWPRTTSNGGFHVKNVVLFFLCLCGFLDVRLYSWPIVKALSHAP